MAQIFSSSFDLKLKLVILGIVVAGAVAIMIWRTATDDPNALNAPVEQEIPFSHKHHVHDDGIDCRYCHAAVEISAFAGIPSMETCMACHSQLFTDAPPLAPLTAAWRGAKDAALEASEPVAGLRVFQPWHSRQQGDRVRKLPWRG